MREPGLTPVTPAAPPGPVGPRGGSDLAALQRRLMSDRQQQRRQSAKVSTEPRDLTPFLKPPRPTVPVKTGSLILAFARVQMTRAEWERHVEEIRDDYIAGSVDRSAHTLVLWNWLSLWLGCLAVVAEGFEKGYEHDPKLLDTTLSSLLASPKREQLKGYRNKIFHPEPYTHQYVIGVMREIHEFVPWAEELTDELDRFFRDYLSG